MSNLILISSGGTGGHMTPASALAHDLKSRGFRVELATDDRGLKYKGMFPDIPVHLIYSGTAGAGIKGKTKGIINLGRGLLQAYGLVRKLQPAVVVGFGGYPSFPSVRMAQVLKIPTVIHEQNAILGKANDMLEPRVRYVALSFPIYNKRDDQRYVVTGNPIRPDIASLQKYTYEKPDEIINLLVMGGSLGATVFSDVVPQAILMLPPEMQKRLRIVQQARAADINSVRAAYEGKVDAKLSTFFDNMAEELHKAHLIICRSGASTVAEISAAGKPAIYVPYPHHKDQQQKRNAQGLVDYGGGWMYTEDVFTPEALHDKLAVLFRSPQMLLNTAERSKAYGRPDAAKKLGDLVESLLKKG